MLACGITHAARSAVIKTPDFPQDPLSPPCRWKGITRVEISPPLHQGRKTIFLDRLNETTTAVSIGKRRKKKERRMERKQRWKENEGEAVQKGKESNHSPASNDNPAFRSRWKHWFNISPPPPPPSPPKPALLMSLWSWNCSLATLSGGKMTAATSNKNVLGVITDTVSFSFLLFFFFFFPSLSHLFPEAITHDTCHDPHASPPSPRQVITG